VNGRPRLDRLRAVLVRVAALARLLRGAGLFFGVHVASLGIAYLANAFIARRIGAAAYGEFAYGITLKNLLLVPATFGLGVGALRLTAAYAGKRDWSLLRGFLRWSERFALAASISAAALFALGVWLAKSSLPGTLASVCLILACALPLHGVVQLDSAKLRGFGRLLSSQLPVAVLYPLLQVGLFWALSGARAWHAAAADALALTVVCLVVGRSAARAVPPEARAAQPAYEARVWLTTLAPLAWMDLVNAVIDRSDMLMVGALAGTKAAGVYSVASRVATVLTFGLVAGNAWAAPRFAELHARGEHAELQAFVRSVARVILLFTVPALVAVLVTGPFLLGIFGPEFREGHSLLVVLALGHLLSAAMGPVAYLTTMTGGQRDAAIVLTVSGLAGSAGAWLLIPRLGPIGAAWAALGARVIWNVAMAVRLRQRTGLRTFAL
jgi:O-antigen/teichoic acid export membrane protein